MCDYISSQVWSESSDGSGAVNFLTGMGGFLQAVVFGYTGIRLVFNHPSMLNGKKKHIDAAHSDIKSYHVFFSLYF